MKSMRALDRELERWRSDVHAKHGDVCEAVAALVGCGINIKSTLARSDKNEACLIAWRGDLRGYVYFSTDPTSLDHNVLAEQLRGAIKDAATKQSGSSSRRTS